MIRIYDGLALLLVGASIVYAQEPGWQRVRDDDVDLYLDYPEGWQLKREVEPTRRLYRLDSGSVRIEIDCERDYSIPAQQEAEMQARPSDDPGTRIEGPTRVTWGEVEGWRVLTTFESGGCVDLFLYDRGRWSMCVSLSAPMASAEEIAAARRVYGTFRAHLPAAATEAAERDRRMARLYLDQAQHAFEKGDTDGARAWAERVQDKYPGSPEATEAEAILERIEDD